jgi:predicted TIM-barrel fold metal-dependent hydrolase
MHCHLAGIGAGGSGCFVSPAMRRNWRFHAYLRTFGVSLRELRQHGDPLVADRLSARLAQSRYVSQAVVLAMDGVITSAGQLDTNRTEIYIPNEFVADMVARHTNLLFGASVNPNRPDALARLDWAKAHGAVLLKWLPNIMGFDPANPKYIPFYRHLVALNLPLLTHTGPEHSFSRCDESLGDPSRLRLPLSLGVQVIAAHVAGTGKYHGRRGADILADLAREYPNLHCDISALTQGKDLGCLYRALHRPEFSGRLLYGSDFPLINTPLVSPWYAWRLPLRGRWSIAREPNPWDRDVRLKQALGAASEVFTAPARLLGVVREASQGA